MDAVPIKEFATLVAEGVVNPRPVARRLIEARPDMRERFMMVGLAVVLQAMVVTVVAVVSSTVGSSLFAHLIQGALQFVIYVVVATLAYNIGARFGGKGAPAEVATAVAWHALLSAALAPLFVGSLLTGGGAMTGLLVLLFGILNIWLLASCIAEAHRFERTGPVAAAVFGGSLVLALIAVTILSGASG